MPTLHIHLDESGNFSWTPKGTKFYVMAAAWTYDPMPLAGALSSLRFGFVRQGLNIESFHASPDQQHVRDRVVDTVLAHENWRFSAVVIEKNKINPSIREPHKFYPKFAGMLLKFVLRGSAARGAGAVLVYADTLPFPRSRHEGATKAMKVTCAQELPIGVDHHVNCHSSASNAWLQVVDYCSWAVFKKWEVGDSRTYDRMKSRLAAPELDVCASGDQTQYY